MLSQDYNYCSKIKRPIGEMGISVSNSSIGCVGTAASAGVDFLHIAVGGSRISSIFFGALPAGAING